jgi:hypothetical protein
MPGLAGGAGSDRRAEAARVAIATARARTDGAVRDDLSMEKREAWVRIADHAGRCGAKRGIETGKRRTIL